MGTITLDAVKNFAQSYVVTAPSPATSGTSLTVSVNDYTKFPTAPYMAVVCPANTAPTTANAEIVRVVSTSTNTFTITRAQESSNARSIVVGDQIFTAPTAYQLTSLKTYIDQFRALTTPPVTNLATSGTTEQALYSCSIPATNLAAATTVRIVMTGIVTGTTPTMLMRMRFGTAGTTADTAIAATVASAAITSGAGWRVVADMTCRTAGSSGTIFGKVHVAIDGLANILSAETAAVTVNTLNSNFLTMFVTPGGTTPVVTRHIAYIDTPNP